jgi:hypothetical protein
VGTQRYWHTGCLFCTETAEQLKLQLHYCVGIQRYWQSVGLIFTENSWIITVTVLFGDTTVLTDRWFCLYWKQLNTTYEVAQKRQNISAIIRPLLRISNKRHLTQRYRLLSDMQQYRLTNCMEQRHSGKANGLSASQEIFSIIWIPVVPNCLQIFRQLPLS